MLFNILIQTFTHTLTQTHTQIYDSVKGLCVIFMPKYVLQLRLEEERRLQSEARAKELEKQVNPFVQIYLAA